MGDCGTSLNGAWLGGFFGDGGGGGGGVAGVGGLAFSLWNIRSSQKGLESISKKDNEGSRGGEDLGSKSGAISRLWGISNSGLSKAHHEDSGPYLDKDRGGKGRAASSSFAWTEGFREGSGYLSVGPGDMQTLSEGLWVCCL